MINIAEVRDYAKSLKYETLRLPDMELETDGDTLVAKIGEKDPYVLSGDALEDLCSYLEIPNTFANKLIKREQQHILTYLHKNLSQYVQTPLTYVSRETEEGNSILSFTEDKHLPFVGEEIVEVNTRVQEMAATPDFPLELKMSEFDNGMVQYLFLAKEAHEVKRDIAEGGVLPLWKWGYAVNFNILGREAPSFGTEVMRMICANLTYLPQKSFGFPFKWEGSEFDERYDPISKFFKEQLPEADWKQLNRWIRKKTEVPASLKEVKDARKEMMNMLKSSDDDLDTQTRVDQALHWSQIVKAYNLDDLDFTPSTQWYARATTPLTCFDLYNHVTREGSAAPLTIPFEKRQGLLVYGGNFLAKNPDLQENPPVIQWAEVVQ